MVAPFAGAWIEIMQKSCIGIIGYVAPFAGAWIEIFSSARMPYVCPESLPSRERGLKCLMRNVYDIPTASLPSRERGLKLDPVFDSLRGKRSLPSRERGLKLPG